MVSTESRAALFWAVTSNLFPFLWLCYVGNIPPFLPCRAAHDTTAGHLRSQSVPFDDPTTALGRLLPQKAALTAVANFATILAELVEVGDRRDPARRGGLPPSPPRALAWLADHTKLG